MNETSCPYCGATLLHASGSPHAEILIIGEFPGKDEIDIGKPFVGATGRVLRTELAVAGIDMIMCRVTNLWLHENNKKEDCFYFGFNQAVEESRGRRAILLVGSETVQAFCDLPVSSVCGLEVDSMMLSAELVMAVVNPAIVFHTGNGELRLALKKFNDALIRKGIL